MADDRQRESINLMVGFVVGSLTIGLLVYLISRSLRGGLGGASGQPINIYNIQGGQDQLGQSWQHQIPAQSLIPNTRQLTNAMELNGGVSLATRTDTVTLPTTRSVRVFSAPRQGPFWRMRIHVIGPAGAFGSFAVDTQATADGRSSIVVPAGQFTELRIGPRQILSGIAVGGDAQVSYSASAEVV